MTESTIATFRVDGEPVSKSRARFTKRGSKTFAYTPQKTLDGERAVARAFRAATDYTPNDPEAAYAVEAEFFNGTRQRRDVDNMVKLVLDGLNKVAWEDDNQVIQISAKKHYVLKTEAHTLVTVKRVGSLNPPTAPCKRCGTPFKTYQSWMNDPSSKKFCSRECGYAYRIEQRERTCQHCGGSFLMWGPTAETKFCSRECSDHHRRMDVTCNYCGKAFTVQRSAKAKKHHCSPECLRAANKERRSQRFPGTCGICGGGTTRKEYVRCNPCKLANAKPTGKPK